MGSDVGVYVILLPLTKLRPQSPGEFAVYYDERTRAAIGPEVYALEL